MPPPLDDFESLCRSTFVGRLEWHDEIASTNDRGQELAGQGDLTTPLLIVAGRQTAGRGRGGNRWWSDTGALTFSLVFDPRLDLQSCGARPLEVDQWPRIALVAGVALCDVLESHLPRVPCGLKWPNDVLLAGKKVAGILAEVPPARFAIPRRLVLGIGINVNNSLAMAPADVQATATALCDASGAPFDRCRILAGWLDRFMTRLHSLAARDPELADRWQSLCALRGHTIELKSGNRMVHGACRGIDLDGALLVDTPDGPERLYAGVLVRIV